jgi:hypothetical protein
MSASATDTPLSALVALTSLNLDEILMLLIQLHANSQMLIRVNVRGGYCPKCRQSAREDYAAGPSRKRSWRSQRSRVRLAIDPHALAKRNPLVQRDLQRVCTICKYERKYNRDLHAGTIVQNYSDYCPNASTLEALKLDSSPYWTSDRGILYLGRTSAEIGSRLMGPNQERMGISAPSPQSNSKRSTGNYVGFRRRKRTKNTPRYVARNVPRADASTIPAAQRTRSSLRPVWSFQPGIFVPG